MLTETISFKNVQNLLNKNSLTTNERYLIDSHVQPSLVCCLSNLNYNEIEKVYYLEEENLYRYLFAAATALGLYGNALDTLLERPPFSYIAFGFRNRYCGSTLEKNAIELLIKMILSNGKDISTPHFEGNIPQKFMISQNQKGQEWFESFVHSNISILIAVYEKMTIEDARAHLLANMAYQLYHNNPQKYAIHSKMSMDESLKFVLKKFIQEKGNNGAFIYSDTGDLLSKML